MNNILNGVVATLWPQLPWASLRREGFVLRCCHSRATVEGGSCMSEQEEPEKPVLSEALVWNQPWNYLNGQGPTGTAVLKSVVGC